MHELIPFDMLNILNEITSDFLQSKDSFVLIKSFKNSIEKIFPDSKVVIYSFNKSINKFKKINFDSSTEDMELLFSENELDSYNQYIIKTSEILLIEDIKKDKIIKIEKDDINSDLKSRIYKPIYIRENLEILVNIASNNTIFSEFDLRLINTVSNYFALKYDDLFLKNKIKSIEKSLDRSKSNIKFLFNRIKDYIFILDLDGNFLHVNNTVMLDLNYSMSEINQMNIINIYPENLKDNINLILLKILDNKKLKWNFPLVAKEGALIPVETVGALTRWDDDEILLCISKNISEKKEIEEALKSEHQQMLLILDSIEEIIFIIDPEDDKIIFTNKTMKNASGDIVGTKCYKSLQGLDEHCDFCKNRFILGENIGKTYTWTHLNPVTKRWYKNFDKAIRWPDGRFVRYELAWDITEEIKAEEEKMKKEKELLLRNKISSAFLNLDDEIIYNNILDVLLESVNSPYGIFGYIDENLKLICFAQVRNEKKCVHLVKEKWSEILDHSLRDMIPVYKNNPSERMFQSHPELKRYLSVPIVNNHKLTGWFFAANREKDYTDNDLDLIKNAAIYIVPLMLSKFQKIKETNETNIRR